MDYMQVSRDKWPRFFDRFSRCHSGLPTTIEVQGNTAQDREDHAYPLRGIRAEVKDGDSDTITIILLGDAGDHVTHRISAPAQVQIEWNQLSKDDILEIESADGVKTLVRFH